MAGAAVQVDGRSLRFVRAGTLVGLRGVLVSVVTHMLNGSPFFMLAISTGCSPCELQRHHHHQKQKQPFAHG
jgi:hypothetical protein